MAYKKQKPDKFSSQTGNVFNSMQKCFGNNQKLKTKIQQFNSSMSSVIREGCIEIDNICNRVRQHLSDMEQREKEIYACNDASQSEVYSHGDTDQHECLSLKARKTLLFKEAEINTKDTGLDNVFETTDQNGNDVSMSDGVVVKEEIHQQKEDKTTLPYATASTDQFKGSLGQISTKDEAVNTTDETIYSVKAEKLRNDKILKDVNDSLRAISRVSVAMNCLEKYEMSCELLQEKLRHIAADVHENLIQTTLVDTATNMSEASLNVLNTKEEKPKCLVEKATEYEVPDIVDEKYNLTNTLLVQRNENFKQVKAKLDVKKNTGEFTEPDSLRTDYSIDEIVDEVVDDTYTDVLSNPTPHMEDPNLSKSIQKAKLTQTIQMMKKKLRQQKDVSGSYFEEIKDTIGTLSNNFDIVNKLVDSVNRDIVEFSKTASYIVKDSIVNANVGLKRANINPRKPKRMVNRIPRTKRELQDHSMALNKVCRPITPVVIRKQATTDLRKKLKIELGPKNTSFKNVLAVFSPKCNSNICR